MTHEIEQALADVAEAMTRLTAAFEQYNANLRAIGAEEHKLARMNQASKALNDSASIFLEWAQYFSSQEFQDAHPTPPIP